MAKKRTASKPTPKPKQKQKPEETEKKGIPEGVWTKCPLCQEIIYNKELEANAKVCPKCGNYFRLDVMERIFMLVEKDTFREFDTNLKASDPLQFVDTKSYKERIASSIEKSGRNEAIVTGEGYMDGIHIVIGALDFAFMGGSMGSVVGEKIARAVEQAIALRIPVMLVSASGGARMQESILSLMQMAKTSAALAKLNKEKLPYISVLTDPTTGGVTASFAMLGDVNIAEPKALIGFAGPRVIEQTIMQQLPEGFQRSEFQVEHGMVDLIVERKDLKATIARLLTMMMHATPSSSPTKQQKISTPQKKQKTLNTKS